jgi:hypothetical protein
MRLKNNLLLVSGFHLHFTKGLFRQPFPKCYVSECGGGVDVSCRLEKIATLQIQIRYGTYTEENNLDRDGPQKVKQCHKTFHQVGYQSLRRRDLCIVHRE